MAPTWRVHRQGSPRDDGQRRWDQAYQLLAGWATQPAIDPGWRVPPTQEVSDARCGVRAGLDPTSSPGPDHRGSSWTGCARRRPSAAGRWTSSTWTATTATAAPASSRPGLDRLRDHAALADLDVVLVAEPDRLARNYVHQVLLLQELAGRGCRVEFPRPSDERRPPRPAAVGRSAARSPSTSAP